MTGGPISDVVGAGGPDHVGASLDDLAELARRQELTDRLLAAEGAGHLVHDLPLRADGRAVALASRPWRLDPIPLELPVASFTQLADEVRRRVRAFEAILDDLYHDRRLVTTGVVPAADLFASSRYRLSVVGQRRPRRWLTTFACDCIELADGSWRVVDDLTDAPSGLGYALLNRAVAARAFPTWLGIDATDRIVPIRGMVGVLHRALTELAAVDNPRVVVLSGGHDHDSYVEHGYLATSLGFHMVEGADLVVRQRRLWLRTLGQLEPIDVVYRRLEDPGVDPLEVCTTGSAGVPGLLRSTASGNVVLANAHGSGVIEDAMLSRQWDTAATSLGCDALAVRAVAPGEQPRLHPVFHHGTIEALPVVVRLHAVVTDGGIEVMPGATGRVLDRSDDLRRPTACISKDVWVRDAPSVPKAVPVALPQVDLAASVPTRAADALYWMNSEAERAEAIARAVRVVTTRMVQDPAIASDGMVTWADRTGRMLRAVQGMAPGTWSVQDAPPSDAAHEIGQAPIDAVRAELLAATDAVTGRLGAMLAEAVGVGEYLSTTTGRVLERLARLRSRMASYMANADDLDTLIADLAALSGLWHESTVRGPAWWLGDVGRRLERSLIVLGSVEASLAADTPSVTHATIETVLAANESLIAYRRRHRSDVEVRQATNLLLRDGSNPRSLAASLQRVREHFEALDWPDGVRLTDRALGALSEPEPLTLIPLARATVHEIGAGIVEHWFAAPVNPIVMRGWSP